MTSIRKATTTTLAEKLGEEIGAKYEKEIYKLCVATWKGGKPSMKDPAFVKHVADIEYEKLGMLMTAETKQERKKVLDDIRTQKIGWSSCVFAEVRSELEAVISRASKPPEVAEGVFTCRKCGGKKTTSIGVQLRSADEPMTNFVTCANPACRNRWRC